MSTPREALALAIEEVRFRPTHLRAGYQMLAVDQLLDRVADAVRTGIPVDALVESARFPQVRFRAGYAIADVDEVLRQLVQRVEALDPWVEPPAETGRFAALVERIHQVRFRPGSLREGYTMSEVDELLDRLVEALRAERSVRGLVEHTRLSRVRFREAYDVGDVDAFLQSVVAESAGA